MENISRLIFVLWLVLSISFLLGYVILNFPALFQKMRYTYITEVQKKEFADNLPQLEPDISPALKTRANKKNIYKEDHLYIPKIGVVAPIIWDVETKLVVPKLHRGVAHLALSAHPGERGNVFITGHSSYYWWDGGKYNYVFALLSELKPDDKIIIRYQKETYIYKVRRIFVASPDKVSLADRTENNILTLSTCTPVGTTINRLIVRSDQIAPEVKTDQKIKIKNGLKNKIPSLGDKLEMLPKVR